MKSAHSVPSKKNVRIIQCFSEPYVGVHVCCGDEIVFSSTTNGLGKFSEAAEFVSNVYGYTAAELEVLRDDFSAQVSAYD